MMTTTPKIVDPNTTVWVIWLYWYSEDDEQYNKEITCLCQDEYIAGLIAKSGCLGSEDPGVRQWWMIAGKECLGYALDHLNIHSPVSDLELEMLKVAYAK